MDEAVKKLAKSIESIKRELKVKSDKLKNIRANCEHAWEDEWRSRIGKDYRLMSRAVDSTCRRSEPEVYEEFYKECVKCGEEKIKPR